VCVSVILKWILEMCAVGLGTGSMWLWICVNMKLYEHSNEPLFSIEDGEFLDQLSDCLLLKKHFGALSCIVMWRAVEKQKVYH